MSRYKLADHGGYVRIYLLVESLLGTVISQSYKDIKAPVAPILEAQSELERWWNLCKSPEKYA